MSDQYHDAHADDAIVHVADLTRGNAADLTRGNAAGDLSRGNAAGDLTRGNAAGDLTRGNDDGDRTRGGDDGDRTRGNAFSRFITALTSWFIFSAADNANGDLTRGGNDGDLARGGNDGDLTRGGAFSRFFSAADNGSGDRTHGVDGDGNGGGQGNGRLYGMFLRLLACCAANAAGDPEEGSPLLPTVTSSAALNQVVPRNRFFRIFSSCFGRDGAIEETPAAAAAEPDLWKNFVKASHTSIQWLLGSLMLFVPAKVLSADAGVSTKLRAIISAVQLKLSDIFIPAVLIYLILCSGSVGFRKKCLKVAFQLLSLGTGVSGVVVILRYAGFAPSNLAIGIGVACVSALVIAKFYDHFSS